MKYFGLIHGGKTMLDPLQKLMKWQSAVAAYIVLFIDTRCFRVNVFRISENIEISITITNYMKS